MKEQLHFRVSSALKDIIGKDLITDDNIAVFELVKNSFDAHATRVDITFENIYSGDGKITISDNGKGMNKEDLINKWLFVAYSAKREGTEDLDYRDKIFENREFAGAKGIGRFSCDRLGRTLLLQTTKDAKGANTEVLYTDWSKFEGELTDEFVDISVLHETKDRAEEHGTTLEITDLRSGWDRAKLLKLKDSLAKLINPSKQKGKDEFEIYIHSEEEAAEDEKQDEYRDIVNSKVENFIFETLELKTSKITFSVSQDGKTAETKLVDGGSSVYRIKEDNQFELLKNIEITFFYLNKSAKLTFARRMGVATRRYGDVFFYKNGFRIHPFGEPGEDPLKVNARKTQGMYRFLGLRDIMGRVEIFGDQPNLRETTSRGDGLIRTPTYFQLEEAFWLTLKRMEKYVIDVQKWGLSIEDDLDIDDRSEMSAALVDLVSRLVDSDRLIDIEYGPVLIEVVQSHSQSDAEAIIEQLKSVAIDSENESILKAAKKTEKLLNELKKAKDEAESEAKVARNEKKEVDRLLDLKLKENLLLKEATNEDTVELLSVEHHINQTTFRIAKFVKVLVNQIQNRTSTEAQLETLTKISLENWKIKSLINFVRKAKFDTMSSSFVADLANYVEEYIENVYKEDKRRIINRELIEVHVDRATGLSFEMDFAPLDFNIIVDNLLDNARKAGATKVDVYLSSEDQDTLLIDFLDDGPGVEELYVKNIFDFGFTTVEGGTGIGLFHVKRILENRYAGSIKILESTHHGAHFQIMIRRNNV